MKKTGLADLPLHRGRCPPWLFKRMRELAGAITEVIVEEYGQEEFLRRLSDPFFFQSFGCVLGFDWHSSGLSTTVCGALKEGIPPDIGVAVCGGKGKVSRKTGEEIQKLGDVFSLHTSTIDRLVYSSKMAAKVDNTAVQDGYQLYHHVFIFTEKGTWTVIQQGLNQNNQYARRYHWLSENVTSFVEEPEKAICCDTTGETLNMVAKESREAQKISVGLITEGPQKLQTFFQKQASLDFFVGTRPHYLSMPAHHHIVNMHKTNWETLQRAYEIQPTNYEELLAIPGVGPKLIRALALVSDLVYGEPPSWKDPARFSFAHGGKDGIPYPVDRETYDKSIKILKSGVEEAKLGKKEKLTALRRLEGYF